MSAPTSHAPNAALLIDFDNVTLGVRSDLTKELRHLLDSDIIKGKVSVQRAYADWRRYPQYIVPLSESSIDLIFAPAFGTNKKNATDIRLAIDATELVFTRPEIGTFILLSGDSDFSSLVIKLKEYGKYVIGVGIRESASDILIQNCDEYFSYTDLAGLTKESDLPSAQRDPWELVVEAVQQMVVNRDVMRADRLKQVMQQIDSNFDESNAGFNRFSKFVQEAGNRGLIKLTKQDNGQFEVAPAPGAGAILSDRSKTGREGSPALNGATKSSREGAPAERAKPGREVATAKGAPAERAPAPREGGRGRGRGRGRGVDKPVVTAAVPAVPVAAPVEPVIESLDAEKERGRRRRRGGRGRGRSGEERETPEAAAPRREEHELTLSEAFHLLTRALGELPSPAPHEVLRARMAALHGREDALLEPAAFVRLLRQANDAEVADVRLVAEGEYEVAMHKTDLAMQVRPLADPNAPAGTAPALPARPAAALRYRSGSQATKRSGQLAMVGVVNLDGDTPPAATAETAAAVTVAKKPSRGRGKPKVSTTGTATAPAKSAKTPKTAKSAKAAKPVKSAKVKSTKTGAAKRAVKTPVVAKSDAS